MPREPPASGQQTELRVCPTPLPKPIPLVPREPARLKFSVSAIDSMVFHLLCERAPRSCDRRLPNCLRRTHSPADGCGSVVQGRIATSRPGPRWNPPACNIRRPGHPPWIHAGSVVLSFGSRRAPGTRPDQPFLCTICPRVSCPIGSPLPNVNSLTSYLNCLPVLPRPSSPVDDLPLRRRAVRVARGGTAGPVRTISRWMVVPIEEAWTDHVIHDCTSTLVGRALATCRR